MTDLFVSYIAKSRGQRADVTRFDNDVLEFRPIIDIHDIYDLEDLLREKRGEDFILLLYWRRMEEAD